MKKTVFAPMIAFSILFSIPAFAKEMAQASADTIVANFKKAAGGLSIADFNSLMAAEICVYENFLDYTGEFERILLVTPDLNVNEINQVRDLIKLKVTSQEHIKTLKLMLPSDYDRVVSAMANLRTTGEMPVTASSQTLTVGDVKSDIQNSTYRTCSSPSFLTAASPSLDSTVLDAKVSYSKPSSGSSSDLAVTTGEDGKISFDTSGLGIIFAPAQTTLRTLLIKGTMPR